MVLVGAIQQAEFAGQFRCYLHEPPAQLAVMNDPPPRYHVAKIVIDGRSIECATAEDRQLLVQANAIGEDPDAAKHFSIGRLMLIKDACQLHNLGRHQRLVKLAIDRINRA